MNSGSSCRVKCRLIALLMPVWSICDLSTEAEYHLSTASRAAVLGRYPCEAASALPHFLHRSLDR